MFTAFIAILILHRFINNHVDCLNRFRDPLGFPKEKDSELSLFIYITSGISRVICWTSNIQITFKSEFRPIASSSKRCCKANVVTSLQSSCFLRLQILCWHSKYYRIFRQGGLKAQWCVWLVDIFLFCTSFIDIFLYLLKIWFSAIRAHWWRSIRHRSITEMRLLVVRLRTGRILQ